MWFPTIVNTFFVSLDDKGTEIHQLLQQNI